MRIFLLKNRDLNARPYVDEEPRCDTRPYLPEATWQVAPLRKAMAVEQVTRLVSEGGVDLFFARCDGTADDNTTPDIEIVHRLEKSIPLDTRGSRGRSSPRRWRGTPGNA